MRAFEKRKLDSHSPSTFFDPKVQKKLKTGKAGDKYEVEADAVANKVINAPQRSAGLLQTKSEIQQNSLSEKITSVQKQEIKDDEPAQKKEEDKLQEKDEEEPVQKKEEEESAQAKEEEEKVQQKAISDSISKIQKKDLAEEEPIQKKEENKLQKKQEEEEPIQKRESKETKNLDIESKLQESKGKGNAMSSEIIREMNTAFKANFSAIRIHTDSAAIALCQEIGAQAFTNGLDIYFNKGKYNPESKAGKELLAHELTHTIQQGAIAKK